MKKILLFAVIALLASCSSTKNTTNSQKEEAPKRVKVEMEECEEMVMNNKTDFLRGYGVGTSADKMMARDIASASARNEILNQVQVSASNFFTKYNQQHLASGEAPGLTREDVGKAENMIKSIAEENLKGAKVICSNTYMVGTSYEVHVCVQLTNADFLGTVYNKLSDEMKDKIDYDEYKYKEEMKTEMEDYRKRK